MTHAPPLRAAAWCWSSTTVAGVVALPLAMAVLVAALRWALAEPVERGVRGLVVTVALAAVIVAPAAIAIVARRYRKPATLLVAACCCAPAVFLTWGLTLPILLTAGLLLGEYFRFWAQEKRDIVASLIFSSGPTALLGGAVAALQWTVDPAAFDGGSVGDIVTVQESAASVVLSASAIVLALLITRRARSSDS